MRLSYWLVRRTLVPFLASAKSRQLVTGLIPLLLSLNWFSFRNIMTLAYQNFPAFVSSSFGATLVGIVGEKVLRDLVFSGQLSRVVRVLFWIPRLAGWAIRGLFLSVLIPVFLVGRDATAIIAEAVPQIDSGYLDLIWSRLTSIHFMYWTAFFVANLQSGFRTLIDITSILATNTALVLHLSQGFTDALYNFLWYLPSNLMLGSWVWFVDTNLRMLHWVSFSWLPLDRWLANAIIWAVDVGIWVPYRLSRAVVAQIIAYIWG